MPKEKLNFSFLTKQIEEEIKRVVEKIISEEISTGEIYKYDIKDITKLSYHWYEFEIESRLPVMYKGNNTSGRVDVSFKVTFSDW